jgi:agmatinase
MSGDTPAPGPAVQLVAAPYEATASFVRGCGFGPDALAAELDLLADSSLDPDSGRLRDWSWVEAHHRSTVEPAVMLREVERWTRAAPAAGRFPLLVGGEHTVTAGALAAFDEPASLAVVQFDAHADLRQDYEGTPWNHACVMRRALDRGHPLVQLGIRSAVREELVEVYGPGADGAAGLLVRAGPPAARMVTRSALRTQRLAEALDGLPQRIYVTIDLDALDPSCAPGVGTPEPDGLSFHELLDALEAVLDGRTLVGADVVELCPARDDGRTARLAARLVGFLAARGGSRTGGRQ